MKSKLLLVFALVTVQFSFGNAITVADPVAPSVQPLVYCDPNNDGFGEFDLTSVTSFILAAQSGNASDYVVTYHGTPGDSDAGDNPLPSPYNNITPWNQVIYYRIENTITNAYATGSFALTDNPSPEATIPVDYSLCDLNNNGMEVFDLTTKIAEILGSLNPATNAVTFYTSLTDAEAAMGQIIFINSFVASDGETIFARVTSNQAGCYDVVSFQLHVEPVPNSMQPNYPQYALCDVTGLPGYETFDLTSRYNSIVMGQTGVDVVFYPSLGDAQNNVSVITNPSAYVNQVMYVQTLGVRLTNPVTGCYVISTMDIRVEPFMQLTTPTPLSVCDADANPNNQYVAFDLTVKNSEITQGLTGYTVTYYPTLTDAQNGTNPINNPTSYTNVSSAIQTLGVRVTNSSGCYSITTLDIRVLPIPVPNINPVPLRNCDADGNGSELFNLTLNAAYIRNGDPNLTLHYYNTLFDANTNHNEITNPTAFVSSGGSVWIRVENNRVDYQGNYCYVLVEQTLTIGILQPLIYASEGNYNSICVDYVTDAVLRPLTLQTNVGNPSAYHFEWYQDGDFTTVIGTSPTFTVDTAAPNGVTRHYAVGITSVSGSGCSSATFPYSVGQSGPAAITSTTPNGYTVTNLSGVQSITVGISGYGVYQYSLDNGPHQESNVFDNVSLGLHAVKVWDTEGACDTLIIGQIGVFESQVPAPTGFNSQTLAPGSTLANIVVNGTNVQWYASATNKNGFSMLAAPLPSNTVLVDGTTYYATQTVGGIESTAYLPVTVHLSLGLDENGILPIQYAPNPVKNNLTLQSTKVLKSIMIYTMLGQKVMEQNFDTSTISIDLSNLAAGNYLLKAQSESGQRTIRIIKE